jgi:hypothetical protein
MNYEKQTKRLRKLAAGLLSGGEAEVVVGLKENGETGFPTPVLVRSAEEVGQTLLDEPVLPILSPICWS